MMMGNFGSFQRLRSLYGVSGAHLEPFLWVVGGGLSITVSAGSLVLSVRGWIVGVDGDLALVSKRNKA